MPNLPNQWIRFGEGVLYNQIIGARRDTYGCVYNIYRRVERRLAYVIQFNKLGREAGSDNILKERVS